MIRLPFMILMTVIASILVDGTCTNPTTTSCDICKAQTPVDWCIQSTANQREFVNLVPFSEVNSKIDNICYTTGSRFPDDTYNLFISQVQKDDDTNDIYSYLVSSPEIGRYKAASPECTFTDTVFAYLPECYSTHLVCRCFDCGGCTNAGNNQGIKSLVLGLSPVNKRLSQSCVDQARTIIALKGFPDEKFIALPMDKPSQCFNPKKKERNQERDKPWRDLLSTYEQSMRDWANGARARWQ